MFKLVKGDEDSLEGRVLLFGKVPGCPLYLGVSLAASVEDAVEIYATAAGLSEEKKQDEIKRVLDDDRRIEEKISKILPNGVSIEEFNNLLGLTKKFHTYLFNFDSMARIDCYKFDCDIIDAGEMFPHPKEAMDALLDSLREYMFDYFKQQMNKPRAKDREIQPNCLAFSKEEVKKKLIEGASRINYALENRKPNDGKELSRAVNQFHGLFAGTPLEKHAERHYIELFKGRKEVAEQHFQMLSALIDERYETAAEIRDRLKELDA